MTKPDIKKYRYFIGTVYTNKRVVSSHHYSPALSGGATPLAKTLPLPPGHVMGNGPDAAGTTSVALFLAFMLYWVAGTVL
ncbi:MAG: hypothetical protein M1517_02450 [Deltaproteobacteria bacterium]|nr:hypothetical protein [Deltaproteobacteria bacterium]